MNKNVVKMFLFALILLIAILALPITTNAADYTTSNTPTYNSESNIFVANGTPITISEKDGATVVTWDGGEQAINSETTVIGGYYNPATESGTTIDLTQTSVTMNSGTVGYIVGGNVVDKNYANYDKIHVGTINIDINGGTIKEVSAVSVANKAANVALSASYYSKMEQFYYADNVKIDIANSTVTERVYVSSSYTYAKTVEVNVDNSVLKDGYYALAIGTNGKVDNYIVNINDSTVDSINAGFRAMVDTMKVNVTGKSVLGDVYAGSYYGIGERYADTNGWNGWTMGYVDYGQVGNMTFDFGKDVTYNNIYAGFQFEDMDKFAEKYSSDSNYSTVAAGIKNSENAPVTISVYTAPKVTDSKLTSMISDYANTNKNVTINVKTALIESDIVLSGSEVGASVADTDKLNEVLNNELKNNEAIVEAIKEGVEVASVTLEVNPAEISAEEIAKFENTVSANVIVAKYINIDIVVKDAQGNVITNLTELSEPVSFSVAVPEGLPEVEEGYTRNYTILRNHNGEIEEIAADLSKDGKYITFSSDKFSVYAISYEDVKEGQQTNGEANANEQENIANPQTGDKILIYGAIFVLAVLGLVYAKKRINKK